MDWELSCFLSGVWSNDLEHFPWGSAARGWKTVALASRHFEILTLGSHCLSLDKGDRYLSHKDSPETGITYSPGPAEGPGGLFWFCRRGWLRWFLLQRGTRTTNSFLPPETWRRDLLPIPREARTMISGNVHAIKHFYPSTESKNHRLDTPHP